MADSPSPLTRLAQGRGIKLGLDRVAILLRDRGNPHLTYPVVHIGGTNGKGSTGAFLDAMLRAAGYRSARFTSPPLYRDEESLMVDGAPIDPAAFADLIESFAPQVAALPDPPTPFELLTAAAFVWFAQQNVDCAVIEAGMGGRQDATNVVAPVATVLCPTAMDHAKFLGGTIEAIAREKAGLIKQKAPVVCALQPPGALALYAEEARKLDALFIQEGIDFHFESGGDSLHPAMHYRSAHEELMDARLSLAGGFQCGNAALAVAAAEAIRHAFPKLDREAMLQGLGAVEWPCRFERVMDAPMVIVDGAHNPAAAAAVAQSMPPCVLLLALSSDKDAAGIARALKPIARHCFVSQYDGDRAMDVRSLHPHLPGARAVMPLPQALKEAIASAREHRLPLLVTGSLFTAAQARALLRVGPPPTVE